MRNGIKGLGDFVIFIFVICLMGALSVVNLVFTNAVGETCGIVHPYIFHVDVSSIDVQSGTKANAFVNTIPTSDANENFDTYLRVYNSSNQLIDSNDDFGGVLTSRIENLNIGQYGTIIVEAATFGDGGNGNYGLSITSGAGAGDSTAFNITIDGEAFIEAQIIADELEMGGLRKYALSATQPINILLTGVDANTGFELDTLLTIYDEADTIIASNDDWDIGFYSSRLDEFPAQNYGTVSIEVTTFGASAAGTYNLIITPATQDPFTLVNIAAGAGGEDDTTINYRDGQLEGMSAQGKIAVGERVRYTISRQDTDSDFIDISLGSAKATSNLESEYLFQRGNPSAPLQWSSCVDNYGYVDGTTFTLNQSGMARFGQGITCDPQDPACKIVSRVSLNLFGQMLFYLILPGLVILLPFIAIFNLKNKGGALLWIMMLMFVATHVLTSSLLYVQLATVSGIEALANFAYGILAGAATGSAIAFMDKVLDKLKDTASE